MLNPHALALFVIAIGCAAASLLMADAADEALRNIPGAKRRRATLLVSASRFPLWMRPAALNCISLGFLGGMVTSGAILVGAFL